SKTLPAKINVLGEYNVLNAICSYAVAKYFGMDDIDILNGLENFKTTGIRQNIIDVGGFSFFVDCYNASVDSIENSLSVLTKLTPKSGGRRIAVIGDVTGMGDRETEINKKIAKIISSYGIDIIVCYGNNSEIISSLIENKNVSIMAIKERKVLEDWMRNNINRGDITLIKGSSRVKLDEILDTVFGLDLADQRYIDEAHYSILRRKGITYRVFEGYVSLIKFLGNLKTVNIDDFVLGKALKKISREAFLNNRTLEAMIIGHNVIHIGNRAFKGCESLKNIIISENVRIIGSEAFGGCVNLEKIALSKALIYIEKDAFKGCTKLKEIIVSESFKNLGIESFDGCNAKIKTK
ncbi:MAG: leucine-rich repeat protein, partial [Faecalibacillus sp.]